MPTANFTDIALKRYPAPQKGSVTYWDTTTRGLGLRVSSGGARTFIVLIDSGRRQKIGRYPTVSLADARTEAKRILAEKTLGKMRPTHKAFDDARDEFLKDRAKHARPRTVSDYTRLLKRHYPFARKSVGDIKPKDVLKRLQALSDTPAEKLHAFTAGRAFFRWCVSQHIIDRSPMESISVSNKNSSRERVLTDDELKAVYRTARDGTTSFHKIVALLIHTGQRRGEIAQLQWHWIKDNTITLPGAATKNRRTHTFPIGQAVKDIIADINEIKDNPHLFPSTRTHVRGKPSTVFNGWGKPKAVFDTECGVTGWTLHDLRRTFSSGMASLGIPQIVVEKLLNHISGGTQSPIAQVYNRYTYMDEMTQAIAAWDAKLHLFLQD